MGIKDRLESDAERKRAIAIVNYATKMGESAVSSNLIESKLSSEVAKLEIDRRVAVRSAVVSANRKNSLVDPTLADQYIEQGLSVDDVKTRLAALNAKANTQGNQAPEETRGEASGFHGWGDMAADVYGRRAERRERAADRSAPAADRPGMADQSPIGPNQ